MTFPAIVILLASLWMLVVGLLMTVKNLQSLIFFKVAPVLFGLYLFVYTIVTQGWISG